MKPFLILSLFFLITLPARAQVLDTLETLVSAGRIVDAKLYVDGIADTAIQNTMRYQLTKGHIYLELYRQSVELFNIKNNNWLADGCVAYMDGLGDWAQHTRVPDSLFMLTKLCYESSIYQAVWEQSEGSPVLAEDLYYSAEYSANMWVLLSGMPVKDTFAVRHLGLYFYRKGLAADDVEEKKERYTRAKYYLAPLVGYKDEEVLAALKEIESYLK